MNKFLDEIKKVNPLNINSSDLNKNRISKNIRKSIALYNRAIANLRTDDIDSAIIDLKKSLSYNSGFCEATKLLGLCYACKGDFSKAEKFLQKLRRYNLYSDDANEYLKKVQVEKAASEALEAIRNVGKRNVNSKLLNSIGSIIFSGKCAVSIAVIAIAGLLILAYRHYPVTRNVSYKAVASKAAQKESEDKKYNQLSSDYKDLQLNFKNTKSELDNLKNKYDTTLQLNNAEKAYKDGDYEETVQILLSLKDSTLDDASKAEIDTLWKNLKTNAVWTIYKQGNSLYKQKKYAEALPKLSAVEKIGVDSKLMPWILYQIGMCYKETNDPSNANIYFQKVKSDYPNSKYAYYSN